MTPDAWLDVVAQLLGDPPPTEDERAVLLELARVAAHTSERWTAPVTTYAAGLALATVAPADRPARLAELLDALEARAVDASGA